MGCKTTTTALPFAQWIAHGIFRGIAHGRLLRPCVKPFSPTGPASNAARTYFDPGLYLLKILMGTHFHVYTYIGVATKDRITKDRRDKRPNYKRPNDKRPTLQKTECDKRPNVTKDRMTKDRHYKRPNVTMVTKKDRIS